MTYRFVCRFLSSYRDTATHFMLSSFDMHKPPYFLRFFSKKWTQRSTEPAFCESLS